MRDAKDYPETVDLVAKKLFDECEIYTHDALDINGEYAKWNEVGKNTQDYIKFKVITVLNTVNYFDGKTCKDCDFFENVACITPEGDYSEDPNRKICTNFAPKGLVGTQGGC